MSSQQRKQAPRWRRGATGLIGAIALMVAAPGCGWQSYAVTRSARHFTGVTTRVHVITPLTSSLHRYRVIELRDVANLLPAHVSADVARDLDARLQRALGALPSRPRIERVSPDDQASGIDPAASEPALTIEGALDDFESGSRALRVLELGFNHIAVTVHVRVLRQDTGDVLGAVSVTAQDNRESGTTSGAMDRVVSAVERWMRDGYAR